MTNLAAALVDTAHSHPDRPAIRLDERVLTYVQSHAAAGAADLRERG